MSQAQSQPAPATERASVTADLWRVVSAFRWRVVGALFFLILAKLAVIGVPLALKRIVDVLGRPELVHTLPVFLLAGYAILRFASTLFNELRDLMFSRVTQQTVATYALNTFAHLHELGARFHATRRIGGLLPDIDRGTSGIAFLLGVALFTVVPTLLEIGMVIVIMTARYNLGYTAILGVTFLCYTGFTLFFTARRTTIQRRVNRLDSNAKSLLADSLINYETVKYFTNEQVEANRFRHIMGGWAEAAVHNQKALFTLHVGQSAIIAFGVASVMLLAGMGVMSGEMTVGDLVLINAYVIQICLPLNSLGFVYREAKDAMVNAEKLFALLRAKPDIDEPPGLPALHVTRGEVVFDKVNFGYDPARPILRNLSFRIPAGKTVAVVGGSGSGKSTLARLLLRFYDVGSGSILIDGQDIRSVNSKSLREAIGVVPQEAMLFNDTIAYNIGYGRVGATHEEIVAAAKAAQVHEFINSLPQKYETPVGERGVMLSGGEKQRLSLARAILKNPPILIFDEATSALDSRSERAIQVEMDRMSENRTALIIAHRLSTVVAASEILVLERGTVVERGTHAELVKREGLYARMWQLQQHTDASEQMDNAERVA
ncbi:ABCB family ABC transporter ATP-binding protein/permease [Noviherbaspirillum massiliense]|uniref:ABCB family ABC transporter ATP-binding protein/permease n=1 Tax=Noviherbaspirillum massiliense TaxID=1465823 RepID=UPI000303487C|nr:ABC transporter ATP-binding protein/permease [Noviherbaspirillum massiliense]